MQHLVIVDGHHLMYRAYWAIPRTMTTSKGEQVNTPFGVASMLLQILKTEKPSHLLFCFDAGSDTFRHVEYEAYKSGRAETPDDFYVQIPRTLSLIDTFGIRSVSGKEHEADDYAGTYAAIAARSGFRTTIVSGDRDLLQLVSDSVRVAIPHKGYSMPEYLGPAEVYAKFGVTPKQIPSYKGLVGDSSDNLPGVKGIGPKAAEALLKQYGSLQDIYAHLSEIKPAWRTKLEADQQQAFFCERMATLISDIELPLPLETLALQSMDATPVFRLFEELEFHLLRRRFEGLLASDYGRALFTVNSGDHESLGSSDRSAGIPVAPAAKPSTETAQMSLL